MKKFIKNFSSKKVLSLDTLYPGLIKAEYAVRGAIPIRASKIMEEMKTGKKIEQDFIKVLFHGLAGIRKNIASFIQNRDNLSSTPDINDIFLTNGASNGVHLILSAILKNSNEGVLIPIPQYPLYSALLALKDAHLIPYYLDESNAWGVNINSLKSAIENAKSSNIVPKGLVLINPGNPTGQVFTNENLQDLVRFCYDSNIVIMADEVPRKRLQR